jgi:hypothetical protein
MPCKSKCGGACGSDKAKSSKAAAKGGVNELEAYKALTKKFTNLGVPELVSLAGTAVNIIDGLKQPTAAEKKSADKLYQWFQNNWSSISPKLDDLDLDEDEEEDDEGDDGAA